MATLFATVVVLLTCVACDDEPADEPTRSDVTPERKRIDLDASAAPAREEKTSFRGNTYALRRNVDGDAGASDDLQSCDSQRDCPPDDDLFCNGIVACQAYRSLDGKIDTQQRKVCVVIEPCPSVLTDKQGNFQRQLCDETQDSCDCNPLGRAGQQAWYCNPDADPPAGTYRITDMDGDNVDYAHDCDDADPRRHPLAEEVCDPQGLDEDCDLDSVVRVDRDGDGVYAAECLNVDPATGHRHAVVGVADCNDQNDAIYAAAAESCDYEDNDCDGKIDEDSDGRELGLRQELCVDNDGDGYALEDAERQRLCLGWAPARLIACAAASGPFDCDDDPKSCGTECQPGLAELCDGYDNNCNGVADEDEQKDIQAKPSFSDGTLVECRQVSVGHTAWAINESTCPAGTLWCDQTTAYHGCEADITTRFRCGSCEPDRVCTFACNSDSSTRGCEEVQQVKVGRESACAITDVKRLACWGPGADGQLGNGARARSTKPVLVSIEQVQKVAIGLLHICAIAGESSSVFCWGSDARNHQTTDDGETVYGLLGNVDAYEQGSDTPVEVNAGIAQPRMSSVVDLSLGSYHACVITMDKRVVCWGDWHNGRLGRGQWLGSVAPPDFVTDSAGEPISAERVTSGVDHSCALTADGRVLCWGSNVVGQLGYPSDHNFSEDPQASEPQSYQTFAAEVPGLANIVQLEAGSFHTCAVDRDLRLWCWGSNDVGELGRADTQNNYIPEVVAGLPAVRSVTAGTQNTCIISEDTDSAVWCWGSRSPGFMGPPLDAAQQAPIVLDIKGARAISASETLCVLSELGVLSCLGINDYGQTGSGDLPTQTPVLTLSQVAPLTD